jgi:hypothetical protein
MSWTQAEAIDMCRVLERAELEAELAAFRIWNAGVTDRSSHTFGKGKFTAQIKALEKELARA